MMKKIVILFLLLCILSGCGERISEKDLIGKYHPTSCRDEKGNEYEIDDEELIIEEDGKGTFRFMGNLYEIEWIFEDGKLRFEDSSGDTFIGTYAGGVLSGKYFYDYFYEFKKDAE